MALSRKKTILYLPSLEMGGSERQGLLLASYLKSECGADVEVWGVAGQGLGAAFCDKERIPWRIVPLPWQTNPLKRFRTIRSLGKTLASAKPDVLLPFTVMPSFVCGLLWQRVGASVSIWNQRDILRHTPGFLWKEEAVRRTLLFVSNSSHGAQYLEDFFHAPKEKIRIVPNGIRLDPPGMDRQRWRSTLGVSEVDFLAVMVANLHSDKDHPTVLRAWKEVVAKSPVNASPVLALAGSKGDTYPSLLQLSRDLEIERNVRFPGEVKDVAGLLGAADLGIMSSKAEGSPNSVLECMAAGLPVVGSSVAGVEEAIGPAGRRFLFPPGDGAALAGLILDFVASPDLRRAAGEEHRKRIEEVFSPKKMCLTMVSLILEGIASS